MSRNRFAAEVLGGLAAMACLAGLPIPPLEPLPGRRSPGGADLGAERETAWYSTKSRSLDACCSSEQIVAARRT